MAQHIFYLECHHLKFKPLYLIKVDCSRHISLPKKQVQQEGALVEGTKQGRQGWVNRWVSFNWKQGTLKGEVSLYCWPPVWLVWNQLYYNWQFLFFICKNSLIQAGQTGGQLYSDTSP